MYDPFSGLHPISFTRVLPFQPEDPVVDDPHLIGAEAAHLANHNDLTRREVIDAYARCSLLSAEEADHVKSVIDLYGVDFFELMGLVYANAGMYICALRWYREFIREAEALGVTALDDESVDASVGYCLYALGLFEEAIAWTKSCVGPRLLADMHCETLLDQEAQQVGGRLRAVERAAGRTRYTLSASDPASASQATPQLKAALKTLAPGQEIYMDWIGADASLPTYLASNESRTGDEPLPEGEDLFDSFKVVRDGSNLPRHKLNLLFAICAQADALVESGHPAEARRLLCEAALLEPEAGFIRDRIGRCPESPG